LISGRPSRFRWRGRPTASDELLGRDRPGTPGEVGLRSARSWRYGSHSLRRYQARPSRTHPSRAHHLPGLPPSAIISAGETGEPRVRDGQDFFRPRNPSLSGQPFLPDFGAPCARQSGGLLSGSKFDSGGSRDGRRRCGVTKHVLVAHLPEPQDPDGVTELARFGHVAATMLWPTGTPEFPRAFPGFALSPGGPSGQFSAV
jgi:hypothetical protein